METISSILTTFSLKDITEQVCENLRQQRDCKLSKKECRELEHNIREYRNTDKDIVLNAIVVYAIFYPGKAIRYARQKGVFHHGNSWPYTTYCLEKLDALANILALPPSEQRYLQQKLNCSWIEDFYEETEKKLRRDICRHYSDRIRKQIHGQWIESNFILEILAFINCLFRYRDGGLAESTDGHGIDKKSINDFSNEEISEAASYLIYLYTDEKTFKINRSIWIDVDYVLSDNLERLILLACQRNLIVEWETLVDYLGYEISTGKNIIKIFDPHGYTEKSLRIGYIKTAMQEQLFAIQDLKTGPVGLLDIAKSLVTELGEQIFEWRCEDKFLQRYRMNFPEPLLEPLRPKKDPPLELFREEYAEINFAAHELTYGNINISDLKITTHCSAADLILFKRFFILFSFAQRWLFETERDLRKVVPSLVPVMTEERLISLIEQFVGNREKACELLELLSWDGQGKLDLQYTPILKMDKDHYYIAADILVCSNIVRNSLLVARQKGTSIANSDGQNDPLECFCEKSFHDCSYPYGMRSNVKYYYNGEEGEIDLLVWSDSRLYIIECKNAIMPTSPHEIRATYEHIQKASHQLDLSIKALKDEEFQKTHFPHWGIANGNRTVLTGIILGNRLFTVPNGLRHPVRYAYELNMILASGTVNSKTGQWSCWSDKQFTDDDLARYLSDSDPLSRSFLDAMSPYIESFRCRGKRFQLETYVYNSLLHTEKQNEYLQVIKKT